MCPWRRMGGGLKSRRQTTEPIGERWEGNLLGLPHRYLIKKAFRQSAAVKKKRAEGTKKRPSREGDHNSPPWPCRRASGRRKIWWPRERKEGKRSGDVTVVKLSRGGCKKNGE